MRVLAFDTATAACTVAVAEDGRVLSELTLQVPRAHSVRLMPLIAQALQEARVDKRELDAIAVGVGPGSFTGLRIGLATAKGLAFALDLPVVPVSTLAAAAYGTGAQAGLVVPLFDAKRGQVFTGVYLAGDRDPATWTELVGPANLHIDELAERVRRLREELGHTWQHVTLCGDAAEAHAARLGPDGVIRIAAPGSLLPRGASVAALGLSLLQRGGAVSPDALSPLYLRKSEAESLWESRRSPSTP
nr:MAG: tRNA (adenosine(37)-N6)-threonylcarbamoyltransferase complex dimerization subunit type 1 TsaB [Bacillota bacterium]